MEEKNKECICCGKIGDDVTFDVDPYSFDIFGDTEEVWMCKDCRDRSAAIGMRPGRVKKLIW